MEAGKKVFRTETIMIRRSENISMLAHLSKNLYNEANYIVRQTFVKESRWIRKYELNKILKASENFRILPALSAQQTIARVDDAWKSFFRALKEYRKDPKKFLGRPKIPGYKMKNGEFNLYFSYQQCSIHERMLRFPNKMDLNVVLGEHQLNNMTKNLREVRIIPESSRFRIEIVYTKHIPVLKTNNSGRIIGIDLGVSNLATIGNNFSEKGIAVRAGLLRSLNLNYNNRVSELQSIYDRQQNNRGNSRIRELMEDRNRTMKDWMHKASSWIVRYAVSMDVHAIVIGLNRNWKQNTDMGRKGNRRFMQIPFDVLVKQIEYKAEEHGIHVAVTEEDHTSICSFLDGEEIRHHDTYAGKRISRGMFRSHNGTLINADLNAAYNMIRKVFPDAFADGVRGAGLHPVGLSISEMNNPLKVEESHKFHCPLVMN